MIHTMMDRLLDNDTAEIANDARHAIPHFQNIWCGSAQHYDLTADDTHDEGIAAFVHSTPEQFSSECHGRRGQWARLHRGALRQNWKALHPDTGAPVHDVRCCRDSRGAKLQDGMRSPWKHRVDEVSKTSSRCFFVFSLCISTLAIRSGMGELRGRTLLAVSQTECGHMENSVLTWSQELVS